METIFWIAVGLFLVAATAVGLVVRNHNRMFKEEEDPVPLEDSPGRYEECEFSEWPYIENYQA